MGNANYLDATVIAHKKLLEIVDAFPQRPPFFNYPDHEGVVFDTICTFLQLFICGTVGIPPIRIGVLDLYVSNLIKPRPALNLQ